jgi:uncharacterized protein (DUF1800 family)
MDTDFAAANAPDLIPVDDTETPAEAEARAQREAYIAINRFGFGGSRELFDRVKENPRRWLLKQIRPNTVPKVLANIGTSAENYLLSRNHVISQGGLLNKHMAPFIMAAIHTPTPFAERLVHFWANHFTVAQSGGFKGMFVPYVNEAIRPNLFGKFEDMLKAVTIHPAMMNYLNSDVSIVQRKGNGEVLDQINENHARELLELHTVSIYGGYKQQDIRELAYAMTGWTFNRPTGTTVYAPRFHADKQYKPYVTIMGVRYPNRNGDTGSQQLMDILHDLGTHPKTYAFIAKKLLRHFWRDAPGQHKSETENHVTELAALLGRTGGDLGEAAKFLVNLDPLWDRVRGKFKTPIEYFISAFRTAGLNINAKGQSGIHTTLDILGQQPFNALSPEGWSDIAADWFNPNGIIKRIHFAGSLGRKIRAQKTIDLGDLREDMTYTLGPALGRGQRRVIDDAVSDVQGIQLLLSSPAFLWR